MSCYIPSARRYFRKSLKTRNLQEASKAALEQYFELRQRLERGENIFSRSVQDLTTAFLESEQKRIRVDGRHSDGITGQRFTVVKAVVGKHFLKFAGEQTRLEKVQPNTFLGYYDFRRKGKEDIRKSTLKNERSLLTAMCRFGVEKGFLPRGFIPQFPKISVNTQKYQSKEEARDAFTLEQFEVMARQLNKMADNAKSGADAYDRKLFRDFVRIASVTGLRLGEQRKLKWSMVELGDDDSVLIRVPKDTKTGARPVAGPGANLFQRIREYSSHTKPGDWVFADQKTGQQFSKRRLYDLWAELMEATGLKESGKNLTFYSLRHTYCTFRLMQNTDVFVLARNMGTSVKFIEDHYGHVQIEQMKALLSKPTALNIAYRHHTAPGSNILADLATHPLLEVGKPAFQLEEKGGAPQATRAITPRSKLKGSSRKR